jgi:integrase
MARALTARSVELTKSDPHGRIEIPDGLLVGLYLVIQPSGVKSWTVRYRFAGRTRNMTLGRYPALALKDARKAAGAVRSAVAEGRDPGAEKVAARATRSCANEHELFQQVTALFVDRHLKKNRRPRYAAETERLLQREVLPRWSKRRIREIGRPDVLDLLDAIVDRGGRTTANKTLRAIRKLFNWAIDRGIVDTSPCTTVKEPLEEKSRDRVLTDDEIRWLWRACDKVGYPFGPLVKLLLLTGQRRSEVAGMAECELDFAELLWKIPGARTKNGKPHDVPLSDGALEVLQSSPRLKNKLGLRFTTTGETLVSGFSRAKYRLDKAMLELARQEAATLGRGGKKVTIAPWRLHDLRRTVASGMARLRVPLPVIEKVLNHASGSFAGIVSVYQRHDFADEKREALQAWARFVSSLTRNSLPHNVVEITRARPGL